MENAKRLPHVLAAAVSNHRQQTLLVEELFRTGFFDQGEIRNAEDPETGDERVIYEWHLFPDFSVRDFGDLEAAGIPVLRTRYGSWVGFDSFGSPYDMYVRPKIAEALMGRPVESLEITDARSVP
jgi:hypothetical protein